ncbi:MAG: outer membrane protein transport protein, partial [Candidatus Phytoplasma australasiaticum]|nr:outer membrane protein transport protein [Candidatus Phytoplasma australasiaticum]
MFRGSNTQRFMTPVVFGFATLLCGSASAGGILIYEAGQEGNGLANAGAAALAVDPSVLMSNPAGITQLSGTQVSANAQVILG